MTREIIFVIELFVLDIVNERNTNTYDLWVFYQIRLFDFYKIDL